MTQQTHNDPTLSNELVQLTGVLKRIVFTNATNGYSVCILDLARKEGLVTITGSFSGVQCGETLKVCGAWITHPTFGKQFKCTSFETTLPADVHGIRQYLSSGLIHGIGQEYANKIVEYFGTQTLHVLNEASARLTEVPGIGKKRATMIKKAWDTQQEVRDTMIFLQAYGITNTQCLRLYQKYGDKTKDVITQNPYILIDTIDGIGFKSADKIALNLGLTVDSPFRIDAGIDYIISQAEGEGNTGVIETELIQETAKLLDLQSTLISQRIPILIDQQIITLYPPLQLIQHNRLAAHEASIAKHIERLYSQPSTLPPIKIDSALQWSEAKLGITWSDTQKNALQAILKSKLAVLTGGPGTGKTTLLRALVSILTAKHVRIGLCAPTGRAAQRMNETTGWTAQTVHRLLKYEPTIGRFTYDEDNLLPVDFLIIDETSMLD
ncbi:MAG TPA: ATP-dependent RecD-like DNA helicase, partial [Opitutae bacterium]|nr:ATP-dependent RecD-like DNA helicase [Opitutae bacterium]